jgi:phosphatidate cytidylyltransferase
MGALRLWTVDQQVALLFVVLFGVLGLVSGGAALVALREGDAGALARRQQFTRDLRAVWLSAVLFWAAWVSGPVGATLLFGAVSFLALREMVTLMKTRRGDHRSLLLAFFAVLPLQYAMVATRSFDLFSVFIPVYVFLAIPVLSALAGDPTRFLERNAGIQWGVMVCVYGLSHAPALLLLVFPGPGGSGRGAFLLFFLVMVAATAQITQELASRRLRRRPLARLIDRDFSLPAWALGTASAALLGVALSWITPFKPGQALAMAAIAGGAGTLGDFVLQALKKDAGVRWWGNTSSVTGAVGLLDRVAPLCFAAPVFFHSVRWYFALKAA